MKKAPDLYLHSLIKVHTYELNDDQNPQMGSEFLMKSDRGECILRLKMMLLFFGLLFQDFQFPIKILQYLIVQI